jgi:hypothetical protein
VSTGKAGGGGPDGSATAPSGAGAQRAARAAEHGLVTARELAEHYGLTEASARRLMSDHGIHAVTGYPRDEALSVIRPGRGKGGGRPRKNPPS